MFGIHRQNRHALLPCAAHDNLSGADQRLLVGQCDVLARVNRREGREQADHADHRRHNRVDRRKRRRLDQSVHAGDDTDIRVRQTDAEVGCLCFVIDADQLRMQQARLAFRLFDIGVDRDGADLRVDAVEHVDGLCADRAGRTQNG